MKTTIKIIILLLAVTCAIGGVMIYAKTKVAPPVIVNQTNQYKQDVNKLVSEEMSSEDAKTEDEFFAKAIDRIRIFEQEGKMEASEADTSLDQLVGSYSSRFLKRCFAAFRQSEWKDETLNYILSQSALLKGLTHSDKTSVIKKSTIDSLNLAASIISDYRDARRVSRVSTFTGYDNARSSISKARTYANNQYLSNCRTLLHDLNTVKSRLAKSCYNQVVAKVDELGNYHRYNKSYYDNTLVPQVDQVVTNYDNKAAAIFGYKENVNALWNRAKDYYDNAMEYYGE